MAIGTFVNPTVTLNGFNELVNFAASNDLGRFDQLLSQVNAYMVAHPTPSLTWDEAQQQAIVNIMRDNGIDVTYNGNGQWSTSFFQEVQQTTVTNPANSNITQVFRGSVRNKIGMLTQKAGDFYNKHVVRYPASGGLGAKAQYLIGSAAAPLFAASAGIKLGKTISGALYNTNPDFWDSIGWSGDPETWGGLTNGDDSPFAGLLNFILGIDPDNNNAQMYMDQETLAYMAYMMNQAGVFAEAAGFPTADYPDHSPLDHLGFYSPLPWNVAVGTSFRFTGTNQPNKTSGYVLTIHGSSNVIVFAQVNGNDVTTASACLIQMYSLEPFTWGRTWGNIITDTPTESQASTTVTTLGGTTVYYASTTFGNETRYSTLPINLNSNYGNNPYPDVGDQVATVLFEGTITQPQAITGIGDQDGATLPTTSTWDTPANTLTSLQSQYPDWFTNPLVWNDDYGDTMGQTKTYIPVPFPYIGDNPNQPTSINPDNDQEQQVQNNTQLIPDITPSALTEVIAQIIQQTKTQTETEPENPPTNPTDTGTGTTDPPIAPTGTASALWSVYHPTQAQVNEFGAWLWGGQGLDLDSLKKVLNDPMSGLITLHKVFAPPVDSGASTIVVGRLDSGVASATVNQQYVTVDCGTVDLYEQFGNVFDYDPFTNVSLYLPFIGIVPLNTSDVMRSSINVVYGVDVYTGACLAQVFVSRDANTVNLYQYSGVASVEYPLTGAQHSGLISGLIGLATSVATMSAGYAIHGGFGAISAVTNMMKTNNARASSFSGNAGAMGIKTPYLIIERPQTKVADTFPQLQGYPTNTSVTLSQCSGQVRVRAVHVEGINATESELREIESLLMSGVLV